MTRYYAAAFLFCMLGLVAAIAFDRPLSALLFSLGASCFVLRAMWAMRLRKPGPAAAMFGNPSDWLNREFTLAMDEKLIMLPPGVHITSNYPQLRKREAFRRYREHWAAVGQ